MARFGASIASLGDLDKDGVTDLAVGEPGDLGAVWVLFMNSNGTVKAHQKIAEGVGGFHSDVANAELGESVEAIGDVDGDGVQDLAVGSDWPGTNGIGRVWTLLMNSNGTVKSQQRIPGPGSVVSVPQNSYFGLAIARLGDLDADGVPDMAVSGPYIERIWILFLRADGTVKSNRQISSGHIEPDDGIGGMFPLGYAMDALGDVDGNGRGDFAFTAPHHTWSGLGDLGPEIWSVFLNSDGTVKEARTLVTREGLKDFIIHEDEFGASVAVLGDVNGDGTLDLAAGAGNEGGPDGPGGVHVIFLDGCAPSILEEPQDIVVEAGQAATLSVEAEGVGLTYQWRKGATALADRGPISGATTDTLTISPVAFTHEGSYSVVVSNDFGQVISKSVMIDVQQPLCPGDINGNGVVDGLDLGLLLASWSIPPTAPGCGGVFGAPCPADVNADGVVNGIDLGIVLGNWSIPAGSPACGS